MMRTSLDVSRMTRSGPDGYAAALAAALVVAVATFLPATASHAQEGKGRIVCWKDKSGKVVGCGDKVPPEYQNSATREMDQRGVTRGTTESTEDAAKRRAQEQQTAAQKEAESKKAAEQKRQDTALINTYTSEKEIDQKRDRDLQQADIQMGQMKTSLKNATDRYNDVKTRSDAAAKDKKGVSDALKEELAKTTSEKQRFEQMVTAKEKEREDITKRYADQKKRYLELKGEAPAQQAGTK
jgi:hypothetical protein